MKFCYFNKYSNNANSLTFELHNELMRTNAKIEYRKITGESKNELNKLVENDEVKRVQATIDKYVTKSAIHNNLVKIFGERGKEIYENIKPLLKNKK